MKERIRSKTIKSFPLTPTTLGVLPLCLLAYPTETHQFLLLCWKRPKKHLKLASHPLGWEGFTTCLQGSPGGQGRGRGVLLSLVGEQRTEPQSSCPSVWPRGRRQNILSLGPNDISSPPALQLRSMMWPESFDGITIAFSFSAQPFIILYIFRSCGKLS